MVRTAVVLKLNEVPIGEHPHHAESEDRRRRPNTPINRSRRPVARGGITPRWRGCHVCDELARGGGT